MNGGRRGLGSAGTRGRRWRRARSGDHASRTRGGARAASRGRRPPDSADFHPACPPGHCRRRALVACAGARRSSGLRTTSSAPAAGPPPGRPGRARAPRERPPDVRTAGAPADASPQLGVPARSSMSRHDGTRRHHRRHRPRRPCRRIPLPPWPCRSCPEGARGAVRDGKRRTPPAFPNSDVMDAARRPFDLWLTAVRLSRARPKRRSHRRASTGRQHGAHDPCPGAAACPRATPRRPRLLCRQHQPTVATHAPAPALLAPATTPRSSDDTPVLDGPALALASDGPPGWSCDLPVVPLSATSRWSQAPSWCSTPNPGSTRPATSPTTTVGRRRGVPSARTVRLATTD